MIVALCFCWCRIVRRITIWTACYLFNAGSFTCVLASDTVSAFLAPFGATCFISSAPLFIRDTKIILWLSIGGIEYLILPLAHFGLWALSFWYFCWWEDSRQRWFSGFWWNLYTWNAYFPSFSCNRVCWVHHWALICCLCIVCKFTGASLYTERWARSPSWWVPTIEESRSNLTSFSRSPLSRFLVCTVREWRNRCLLRLTCALGLS